MDTDWITAGIEFGTQENLEILELVLGVNTGTILPDSRSKTRRESSSFQGPWNATYFPVPRHNKGDIP
ncbi:MAG: hypothetical protein MUO50_04390, partial [Longimicrobiales bacterium]|nr:hypothetical protein [Longimicrobiales bacterium]